MVSYADQLMATVLQRKFKFSVLVFMTNTLVLILGYVDQDVWKVVTEWTLALFVAGNVGQKVFAKNGNKNDSPV